jgi:hypothetical protein
MRFLHQNAPHATDVAVRSFDVRPEQTLPYLVTVVYERAKRVSRVTQGHWDGHSGFLRMHRP